MAGTREEAIQPFRFMGDTSPVVEPRAILAMSEALRSGLITADEIAERHRMRPLKEAQITEATDPVLVKARKDAVIADSEAKKLALEQARLQSQIPKDIRDMNTVLAEKAWQVRPTTNIWTAEDNNEVVRRYGKVQLWEANRTKVAAELSLLKKGGQEITSAAGTSIVPMTEGSLKVQDSDKIFAAQKHLTDYPTPQAYDLAGSPSAPSIFGEAAGSVSAPAPTPAPTFTPMPAAQPTPMVPGLVPTLPINAQPPAPLVTPRQQIEMSVTPAVPVAPTPRGLMIKGPDTAKTTEVQGKAALAQARMLNTNEVLENLKIADPKFDPGKFVNWAQDYMVGPFQALKTSSKKTYDAAKDEWIGGLLRLESGAAIAAKEKTWYETTFFASPGDSPQVQKIKASIRGDVEAVVNALANGGGLDVPALLKARDRGEMLNEISAGGGSVGQEQTTVKGKTYMIDRSSSPVRLIPVSPTTNAAPYSPPARLGPATPKVEPKQKTGTPKSPLWLHPHSRTNTGGITN